MDVKSLMSEVSTAIERSQTAPNAVFWTHGKKDEKANDRKAPKPGIQGENSSPSLLAPLTKKWDIWQCEPVPRHRRGLRGALIHHLKRGYLKCLRPFHNELLRRQRELNSHVLVILAKMGREIGELKQKLEGAALEQRHTLQYTPKFSIIMPVWNTHPDELEKAILSLEAQTYPYWELCICDDASDSDDVKRCVARFNELDARIRVRVAPSRSGIATASNTALTTATGEFVAFLDHDDELAPHALEKVVEALNADSSLDLIYSDEDHLVDGHPVEPRFKPAWSPDLFLSYNYLCHFCVIRRALVEKVGGFHQRYDGAQDYDLLLRITEKTDRIAHISHILYHWRKSAGSVASNMANKPHATENGRRALEDAMKRRGDEAEVSIIDVGQYRVKRQIQGSPKVHIIILTKDRVSYLKACLNSIIQKTTYINYEIIIVDHESQDPATIAYLKTAPFNVLRQSGQFHFSRLNNIAAKCANGEHILFLNNDTQVIAPDWIQAMLEHSQRPEVGAVGAKLLFPNGSVQHAGIVIGLEGRPATHIFVGLSSTERGYENYLQVVRNCTALTGACLMVKRKLFEDINGFDETFAVTFGDVDLCLRLREKGYFNVWTPFSVLYHKEFGTRSPTDANEEDHETFVGRWGDVIRNGDHFYNPNLGLL